MHVRRKARIVARGAGAPRQLQQFVVVQSSHFIADLACSGVGQGVVERRGPGQRLRPERRALCRPRRLRSPSAVHVQAVHALHLR